MMQIDTFIDERMKILYMNSFMCGGMAQVLAANETNVVLSGTLSFRTLNTLLVNIENAFGDPDQERMACMQLHVLKMTVGMMAEVYLDKFEMLVGRTRINDTALERMNMSEAFPTCSSQRSTLRQCYHLD